MIWKLAVIVQESEKNIRVGPGSAWISIYRKSRVSAMLNKTLMPTSWPDDGNLNVANNGESSELNGRGGGGQGQGLGAGDLESSRYRSPTAVLSDSSIILSLSDQIIIFGLPRDYFVFRW
jgi:hypothetical protein